MYGSHIVQITNEPKLIIDNLWKEIICFEISELYATTINQKHCAVVIVVLLLNPHKTYPKGQREKRSYKENIISNTFDASVCEAFLTCG